MGVHLEKSSRYIGRMVDGSQDGCCVPSLNSNRIVIIIIITDNLNEVSHNN